LLGYRGFRRSKVVRQIDDIDGLAEVIDGSINTEPHGAIPHRCRELVVGLDESPPMPVEMLTYADLAERLKVSPEAARALAKRLRLPRSRSNGGKALVSVDLTEIQHNPLPGRSPASHQAVTTPLRARIETLLAELARLKAAAAGHRADFERERLTAGIGSWRRRHSQSPVAALATSRFV
jgi:hypothetical protein